MMKEMFKKKLNKKGFTLAELLIVVAILAVLVAVAIPVFGGAITKATNATGDANFRAAKAQATVEYLLKNYSGTKAYTYVAANGNITLTTTSTTGATEGKTDITTGVVVIKAEDFSPTP